jgi:hypothetical protein
MILRTLLITAIALTIATQRTLLAPPLGPDGPPTIGRLDHWEEYAWALAFSGMFGALLPFAGLRRTAPPALLVGPAAWAVLLAAMPPHPMNFCANGGRDDYVFVYAPLALVAGPLAWASWFTPLGRYTVAHVLLVAGLLLGLSVPLFSQGYEGAWLAGTAGHLGILLGTLGLLLHVLAWSWSSFRSG